MFLTIFSGENDISASAKQGQTIQVELIVKTGRVSVHTVSGKFDNQPSKVC